MQAEFWTSTFDHKILAYIVFPLGGPFTIKFTGLQIREHILKLFFLFVISQPKHMFTLVNVNAPVVATTSW